jgi:multidrug efflux pump subunit AcrB
MPGVSVCKWRLLKSVIKFLARKNLPEDGVRPSARFRESTSCVLRRDMDILERTSAELAEAIATYPGIEDIDDGFQAGKQQLDFRILPEGKSLGLSAREVARQVRNAFYGAEVLRQQRGRNELKVMVRLPKEDRATEQTVHDLMIKTSGAAYVPFREIASIERGRAYTTINRRNGRRVVQVTSEITPRSRAGEVLADLPASVLGPMIRRYPGLTYSYEGQQADIRESMASLKTTFILAMLAIYAMLAIPFRSYTQPFVVMLSIPFGIVGAFLGHLIMGYDLCIPSMFGIVALAGVVVNNSLVMIDYANCRIREDGLSEHDAIHAAAIQRFRPIVLTTMTTFGGLAPMIFETSRQARFLVPMALSLGYGIIFATIISLLIVPSMFLLVSDIRQFVENRFNSTAIQS